VVGGTSWLYLTNVAPSKLGLPEDLPEKPLPVLTWKAISKLPFVVIALGLLLSGVVRLRSRKTAGEALG
jgi:hypothetical protein